MTRICRTTRISILLAALLLSAILIAPGKHAYAADDIASGEFESVPWRITSEGDIHN